VRLPWDDLSGKQWRLTDMLGNAVYDRDGHVLQTRGLYIDAAPWQASVFEVQRATG
jgi:hypothetical protein